MKQLLLVAILCAAIGCFSIRPVVPQHPTFFQFIQQYSKKYHSEAEFMYRHSVYQSNIKFIDWLNDNDEGTAIYAVNQFADLTQQEARALRGLIVPTQKPKYIVNFTNQEIYNPLQDTPDIWNWEQQGAVTDVRNQGSCGSCWAFSTAQNVESRNYLKTGKLVDMSEQQLVDCDKSNFGCSGGWPYMAIQWLADHGGLMTMKDYPTRSNYSGPCAYDQSKPRVGISGYMNVTKNETIIKDVLYKEGPLSILLDFTGLTYYKSGIASPRFCYTWPDHALLLVGYGTKDGDYWLIKNTWGAKWGINGYLQLERGRDKCGVSDWATTAVLK